MKRVKFIALLSILICLLIVIPNAFAADNVTSANSTDVLADEYYFDANIDNDDGNGSIYNPYKELTSYRIESDSVIHLANGEYNFNSYAYIDNVTIIGESVENTIVKNARFTVETSLTLYNLTFISSYFSNDGDLKVTNVIFKDSASSSNGGVINSNANVELNGCSFINNSADFGGAIYVKEGNLNIKNSQFLNNYASLFGGAVTAVRSNVSIFNVSGKNNKVEYDGGFLYSMYGAVNVINSSFSNNSADYGAVLYINQADNDKITDSIFIENTAKSGAGIYSLYNFNSIIQNNTYSSSDDLVETFEVNMWIGDGNYTLYNYNAGNISEIPSRYDLRDYGYVTSVKNQGTNGNCWAFATMATLESCILKAMGESLDLSESNLKNLFGNYSDYGWNYETNGGGLASMGYNYLISWLGPVLEVDDPYTVNTIFSRVLSSIMHVQNVLFIQRTNVSDINEINEIKKIIMTYGAVYSQIMKIRGTKQYYNTDVRANHAISIIGWDDTLQFDGAPGDGGWIYKNSWGSNSGDKGYFYVSFYDTSVFPVGKIDSAFTFILDDSIKYDKNYQYDIQGKSDFFYNSSDTVWYKNRFISTDDEYLTAVSTIFEKNTNYTIYIYVNDELKITQNASSKPGYYTFNLNELIPLNKGDIFEVVFKITVDNEAGIPVSEKVSFVKCLYKENISFYSYDGENWSDLYNVSWKYSTHNYNSQIACIKAFTVLNPINVSINLTIENIGNNTCDIIATAYNQWGYVVHNGNITFTIHNVNYTVKIINGSAKLSNVSLNAGLNEFNASFNCIGYTNCYKSILINNPKINTSISLSFLITDNPVVIQATVKDVEDNFVQSGQVTFNIEGINYTVDIVNGIANITHMFSYIGLNNISAKFSDLYCYNPSNCSISTYIPIINTSVNLIFSDNHNPVNISAKVTDLNGNLINYGNVTFTVDKKNYTVNLLNGIAGLNYIFKEIGINNISVQYNGIYNFNSSKNNNSINISLIQTYLKLNVSYDKYNPVEILVNVYDQFDKLVDEGNVIFTIGNNRYEVSVVNGVAKLTHNFKNMGLNNISVEYSKNFIYNSSDDSIGVDISKINVDLSLQISKNLNDVVITVKTSMPIDSEYIYISINDTNCSAKIKDSVAVFYLNNFKIGTYSVKAFLNSYYYRAKNISDTFTITSVISNDDIKTFNSVYSVKFYDESFNLLNNTNVTLTINSKTYSILTNNEGIAKLNINLNPGTYSIKITNPVNNEAKTQTIKVLPRISQNKAVSMYYGAGKYYKVKVLDDNGNIAKGVKVTFTINNKKYTRTTDNKGYASFKISKKPGKYTITAQYKGFKVSNKITVKSTIITKNIKVKKGKTIKFTAKLVNKNGKILKNKKITFKFKGKTYKVKTNKKGKATLKITKKYKVGKYTITTKYGKLSQKNTIRIKK